MRWRHRLRFTLRKLFIGIALIAASLAILPALWHCHITAPRRIDVLHSGHLELPGATVYFPVRRESIEGFYVWDGGTYGVRFIDAKGNRHVIGSWQPLGEPEHHGKIVIGGLTPDSGGRIVGWIPAAEELIFSVMELEDQSQQERPTVMQIVYPTTAELIGRRLPPRLACLLGLR